MDTVTKVCQACQSEKPASEFYIRPGGYLTSECKSCMKSRSKSQRETRPATNKDYLVSYVESERMAIEYLNSFGIPALPGKAVRHSYVDVIVYGCIGVEVKYAKLEPRYRGTLQFRFTTTPAQQKRGFLGDVVLLICDYEHEKTFHLFPADHPVFYMDDRVKTAITFTPGAMEAKKHGNNRVVMTQPMMDSGRDNIHVVNYALSDAKVRLEKGNKPNLLALLDHE